MATSRPPHEPKKPQAKETPVKAQIADSHATAAQMPHNANKVAEHGRAHAVAPPVGQTVELKSNAVGASTLAEANANAKTGEPPQPGADPTTQPLDRVRVDATGQRLTTNQ